MMVIAAFLGLAVVLLPFVGAYHYKSLFDSEYVTSGRPTLLIEVIPGQLTLGYGCPSFQIDAGFLSQPATIRIDPSGVRLERSGRW